MRSAGSATRSAGDATRSAGIATRAAGVAARSAGMGTRCGGIDTRCAGVGVVHGHPGGGGELAVVTGSRNAGFGHSLPNGPSPIDQAGIGHRGIAGEEHREFLTADAGRQREAVGQWVFR